MSPWECPRCGGGFPGSALREQEARNEERACPWCGLVLGKFLIQRMVDADP